MKKLTAFAACFALALAVIAGVVHVYGNNSVLTPIYTNTEPVVLGTPTPVHIPKGIAYVTFVREYDLGEAYEEAPLVAEIVITDWLNESDESTFFSAKLINVYKDEIGVREKYPDNDIVFVQHGTSEFIYDDFPIYEVGTRLFVCLRYLVDEETPDGKYTESFVPVGEILTELELVEYEGSTYAIRSNKYQNFGDVGSSVDLEDSDPDDKNMVVLTMDDVLSYLYKVEHSMNP